MAEFKRAERLEEVAEQTTLEPLPIDDPRYVDISAGRGTNELKKLRICLEEHSARKNRFAKVALTGHRGCGKSTELLRIEQDLKPRFTPLHLVIDDDLMSDCDYPELLLWVAEHVASELAKANMPLKAELVAQVADWFAERTVEGVEQIKAQIQTEIEAQGEARAGLYWFSLKFLARLKSMVQGNVEHRRTTRRKLKNDANGLVQNVNLLLDNAQTVLEHHGKEPDLLIVVDNLDRLTREVAATLFWEHGDLLKRLRTHVVFTVPIAMIMAPWNIGTVFENYFTMPMIKTATPEGRALAPGINALVDLVGRRVDPDKVFAAPKVLRYVAKVSGGSVRDLLRLLNRARLEARADEKPKIDMASAVKAVKWFSGDFERMLVPARSYYPLLAEVHRTKQDGIPAEASADRARAEAAREFFADLLFSGAVLEYGEPPWYDVHPAVREIEAFRDALNQA